MSTSAAGEDDDGSWAARFAGWLTETYAARQSAAADKCGVAPGEAWRAALAAADACGAAQVCPPLGVLVKPLPPRVMFSLARGVAVRRGRLLATRQVSDRNLETF